MLPRACHPVTPLLLGYRPEPALITDHLSQVPGVEGGVQGLWAPTSAAAEDE